MNGNDRCCSRAALNWIGVLGAFVVMGILVAALKHYTSVPTVDHTRAEERRSILAETRQKAQLASAGTQWIGEKSNGIVHLPREVATRLAVQLMQDPAKGRAEMLQRAEKAFYVPPPPPPPPEQPSPFE